MLIEKIGILSRIKQFIWLRLPGDRVAKRTTRFLNKTVRKFKSRNFLFVYDRGNIEFWVRLTDMPNHYGAYCCSLNDALFNTVKDDGFLFTTLRSYCQTMRNYQIEPTKPYISSYWQIKCSKYQLDAGDKAFVNVVSKFNGNSLDEFKIYLDLLGY